MPFLALCTLDSETGEIDFDSLTTRMLATIYQTSTWT